MADVIWEDRDIQLGDPGCPFVRFDQVPCPGCGNRHLDPVSPFHEFLCWECGNVWLIDLNHQGYIESKYLRSMETS